jgi:hypothetical protein
MVIREKTMKAQNTESQEELDMYYDSESWDKERERHFEFRLRDLNTAALFQKRHQTSLSAEASGISIRAVLSDVTEVLTENFIDSRELDFHLKTWGAQSVDDPEACTTPGAFRSRTEVVGSELSV